MKRLAWLILPLILAACSSGLDRKIDGSNEQSYTSSLTAMRKSAKPDEIARLDDALLVLAITDVSIGYEGGILGALKKLSTSSPDQLFDRLMPIVNGKTGREIIAMAQKRKKDEATKQLASVQTEMDALKKLREDRNATKGAVEPIQVSEATLRFNSVGPEKMSVMDFKVRNGTPTGLSYLYLRGTVTESSSQKVLFSDDIKYKLSDEPLMPGVTKSVRLPYGGRGKWNAANIWGREDIAFAIEVVNADDLQAKKLSAAYTSKDAERLGTLEKTKLALDAMMADK
jgi:hypothetical protein